MLSVEEALADLAWPTWRGHKNSSTVVWGWECCFVEGLNLQSYEVLYFEALHCFMNHIKNILEEIPHHISDNDTLIKLKEILAVQLNKEKS